MSASDGIEIVCGVGLWGFLIWQIIKPGSLIDRPLGDAQERTPRAVNREAVQTTRGTEV